MASSGRALVGLLLITAILATACGTGAGSGGEPGDYHGIRLDNPYEVPDVTLTDTTGAPYTLRSDRERPLTLVFFGYTRCPDFCKIELGSLAAAMNRLDDDERSRVDMVFVTTDPEYDDEAVLRDHLDGYDPEFIGLTGPLDDVIALGEGDPDDADDNGLHIYVSAGEELPSGGRDLGGHTVATLAIDDSDRAIALWKQGTSALEYADDIHTLLSED